MLTICRPLQIRRAVGSRTPRKFFPIGRSPIIWSLVLAFSCLIGVDSALAQKAPMKWGKIPDEHLAMTEYPADTNAAAIILGDYGRVEFNDDFTLEYTRHRRIKILSEAGYDWGTHSVLYWTANKAEKVTRVKAQTLVPDGDGGFEVHKLGKKAVFEEEIRKGLKAKRFTLPALAPGVIVEYEYKMAIESPFSIPDWQFQYSEPTLWSEFRLDVPGLLSYTFATYANVEFEINENVDINKTYGDGSMQRWAMSNVPALREEPFMKAPDDYRARVDVQFAGYVTRDQGFISVVKTWDELASYLLDETSQGRYLKPSKALEKRAWEIVDPAASKMEQMTTLYDFVRSSIKWTGIRSAVTDKSPDKILELKSGSPAEISSLLTALLTAVNIESYVMLLSTRQNGEAVEIYPLLSQFDYMVTYARIDGNSYVLDATNALRPYDVLPVRALSGKGWVLSRQPGWQRIEAATSHKHATSLRVEMDERGNLTGTVSATDGGYSALSSRQFLNENSGADFVTNQVFGGLTGLKVEDVEIMDLEASVKNLAARAKVEITEPAQIAGEYLYFNPTLAARQGENPLKVPTRTFPVDLGYPRERSYVIELRIPDGYEVEELPPNRRKTISQKGGQYVRVIESVDNVVRMNARFKLARAVYSPRQYTELREFFEFVLAAEEDQLVLKRSAPESTDGD